jgi:hypothetical protein
VDGSDTREQPRRLSLLHFNLSRRSVPVQWIAGGSRMPLRQPRLFAGPAAVITNEACWYATATRLSVQLELRFITARIAPTYLPRGVLL